MQKNSLIRTAIYLAFGMLPLSIQAQELRPIIAAQLPASTDPGRIGQQLAPPATPSGAPSLAVPGYTPTAIDASAYRVRFLLQELHVTGSSVYGNAQLENMFRGYIGRVVTLADLQRMADAITLRYRNDGYVLTQAVVPAQNVTSGVVTIRVVEGFIGRVDIQGDPKGAREQLLKYADQIMREKPLNIRTLERYILLANDIPGLGVRAVLSAASVAPDELAPSEAVPGTAVLTLIAAQHTASGYLGVDNRGTRFLGPKEYSAGGQINSIFRSGDVTGFQGLISDDFKEMQYIRGYHSTPLGSDGIMLNLATSYSHTEPGFTLAPLDVTGDAWAGAVGITYPAVRSRQQNLYLNMGFDALNNRSDILDETLFSDRIRSIRAGANYDLSDPWFGVNQAGLQVSQGIPGLGATPNNSSTASRPFAKTDYTKFNMNLGRVQNLGGNFSALIAGQGQYALVPLISAEQFGFGGVDYGQAYDPSTITGDRGIAGKAELRYDFRPGYRFFNAAQLFGYYDIGKVWNIENVPGTPQEQSAASAGFGLRAVVTNYLSGYVEFTKPLTLDVPTYGNKNPRIFFSVILSGDTPACYEATPLPPPPHFVPAGTGLVPIKPTPIQAPIAPVKQNYVRKASPQHYAQKNPSVTNTPAPQNYPGLTQIASNDGTAAK